MSRTLPLARESAERLAGLGYEALVAPLLRAEFARTRPDLHGVETLIFTSRNGVAAFVSRSAERRFAVFAVGDATAHAARQAGFRDVASAAGDVEALRRLVLDEGRRDGVILRAGAREPAGTLVADLGAAGFEVSDWPAYRTVTIAGSKVLDQVRAAGRAVDVVLIYSPKAARALSRRLEDPQLALGGVVCISPAAAAALGARVACPVRVAERPDEASMFTALRLMRAASPRSAPRSARPG